MNFEDTENRYRTDVTDNHKRIFALAMQGLFEIEVGQALPGEAAADVIPADCTEAMRNTIRQLVEGAAQEIDGIDDMLRRHLTCKWTLERLGTVERSVLRLGVFIIRRRIWSSAAHVRDLAANCAVEYSGQNAHALVKAVLDAVSREVQGETDHKEQQS